ncbi:cytochrome P450 [Emericellopsis atlantica]|uniref:Cytochrome P450 n=1 Tax=Emericellopsis atlantica TaxID=2614577 RepID=A0A9P8CLJ9_9HYPO|nr:cytochrome P450 [Emericellopsis atlantica]KAG9251100.1 cytochrome P450 [Emericellopsis atlantica]
MAQEPQLAYSPAKASNVLAQTTAFHASPEAFIASCVRDFQSRAPDVVKSRTAVHAKVLNRNVAVISSHAQVKHILARPDTKDDKDADNPSLVATGAYKQFLADFFPGPNLLLSDGVAHSDMREAWAQRMEGQEARMRPFIRQAATEHFQSLAGSQIDLYESLKSLAWKIVMRTFLLLDEKESLFGEIQKLQEDLLRGQFSLFPVSVNLGLWQSPRSRGIAARNKLRELISRRMQPLLQGGCPFHAMSEKGLTADEQNEVVNHVLMFTSSLAVKGIASLLTAYLLNMFLYKKDGVRLLDNIQALQGDELAAMLRSIARETERLSPPIVGIMRRVTREIVVPSGSTESPDVLVPEGWDAWLYFVGAGRDPAAFGDNAAAFVPDRFVDATQDKASGLAFSAHGKACLGQDFVREICIGVIEAMLDSGFSLDGDITAKGVRDWLGWEAGAGGEGEAAPEDWARDMKQLPTQRPAKPVVVTVCGGEPH